MFTITSFNVSADSKFNAHAGKIAATSVVITLLSGIFIYNLLDGPYSFLPKTPSAAYAISGVALLFLVDAIRYTHLFYKKPTVLVSSSRIPAQDSPSLDHRRSVTKSPAGPQVKTGSPKMIAFPHNLINPTSNCVGVGKHRWVEHIQGTNIVVKKPRSGFLPGAIEREYRAFEVSEKLGFHVVPKLAYYTCKEADEIREKYPTLPLGRGDLLLQEYAPCVEVNDGSDDIALFFNWIIGRRDNKKLNSADSKNGVIIEIDNEFIGGLPNAEKHWAISINSQIPRATLDRILALPSMIRLRTNNFVSDHYNAQGLEEVVARNLGIVKKAIPNTGTISREDLFNEINRLTSEFIALEATQRPASSEETQAA